MFISNLVHKFESDKKCHIFIIIMVIHLESADVCYRVISRNRFWVLHRPLNRPLWHPTCSSSILSSAPLTRQMDLQHHLSHMYLFAEKLFVVLSEKRAQWIFHNIYFIHVFNIYNRHIQFTNKNVDSGIYLDLIYSNRVY